jgi:aminomethyltransferase
VFNDDALHLTPLDGLHRALGAKMVPFAGYAMPVQYADGILTEHLHVRAHAGLFDVSHMGQIRIRGTGAAAWVETLVPGDIQGLALGRTRYSVFTNDQGGVLDDLMISHLGPDTLFLVVNAACKEADIAHLGAHLPPGLDLEVLTDRALLALQGPEAAQAFARLVPQALAQPFMSIATYLVDGIEILATRSGYTGEDGFEISVPALQAEAFAKTLLALDGVKPIGLGARDSLRLEAGLCLYGSDMDTLTTPVEAGLSWIIGKSRRAQGCFPGANVILDQLAQGPARLRVGIRPLGRAPARAHTPIADADGRIVGEITSGGFSPSLDAPIAMGYVPAHLAALGTPLSLMVRGKALPATVTALPFVPHRYFKA